VQEAADELRDMEAATGATATIRLLQTWGKLRANTEVSDEDLAELMRLDPISPNVRRAIISALVERRRWPQVLDHLAVLKRMRAFSERDAKVEEIARGLLTTEKP
jgi:hypothetical protein